jgi:hypothetical protein
LKKVGDLVADAVVESMVAGFWYGVEIRAQIYEDLEELCGFRHRDDDDEVV